MAGDGRRASSITDHRRGDERDRADGDVSAAVRGREHRPDGGVPVPVDVARRRDAHGRGRRGERGGRGEQRQGGVDPSWRRGHAAPPRTVRWGGSDPSGRVAQPPRVQVAAVPGAARLPSCPRPPASSSGTASGFIALDGNADTPLDAMSRASFALHAALSRELGAERAGPARGGADGGSGRRRGPGAPPAAAEPRLARRQRRRVRGDRRHGHDGPGRPAGVHPDSARGLGGARRPPRRPGRHRRRRARERGAAAHRRRPRARQARAASCPR